jgi:hypothetical protein
MPTNATGTGGIQLAGNAGAALYGPSLITVTRLLDNLNNRLLTSDETTTCSNLIDSVSAAIRRYCRTDFLMQTYDELYSGNGQQRLLLRQIPVVNIQSVRYGPYAVLRVTNNAMSTNQRATVSVTTHEVGCYQSPGFPTLGMKRRHGFLPRRGC